MLSCSVAEKRKTSCCHDGDLTAQPLHAKIAHVHPIEEDLPGRHVVETGDQVDQGALAGAGGGRARRSSPPAALPDPRPPAPARGRRRRRRRPGSGSGRAARRGRGRRGGRGSPLPGRGISKTRAPAVAARGAIMTIQPRLRIGIWRSVTKKRNLVSSPTLISPLATRAPPNQSVATSAAIQRPESSGRVDRLHDAGAGRAAEQPLRHPPELGGLPGLAGEHLDHPDAAQRLLQHRAQLRLAPPGYPARAGAGCGRPGRSGARSGP